MFRYENPPHQNLIRGLSIPHLVSILADARKEKNEPVIMTGRSSGQLTLCQGLWMRSHS